MAGCSNCGQVILFGGVKHGTKRFCNQKCYEASATFLSLADQLSDDIVKQAVAEFHQGNCPCCGGPGPVDIHFSHRVVSLVALTWFKSIPKISCISCATKSKVGNFFATFFLGWWGFPFGLIITPIYLCRNLYALVFPVSTDKPSIHLQEWIRANLAHQVMTQAIADSNVAVSGEKNQSTQDNNNLLEVYSDDDNDNDNPYAYRDYDKPK